ncbi:NrdH-redoxin [Candidatus Saccharibacteria bacterium]|nr:NrdH-redoxin [Candidatus Saccharibacteria bacterium]
MITVYSTAWCGFCHMAKAYFDKLGVKYNDVDVEQDMNAAKETVAKSGQMGVPVIDIDGTIIVGFNRPMIDMTLHDKKLI